MYSVKGIYNNGNDCYINATLQCLAVSPFIIDFINNYKKNDKEMINIIIKYKLGSNKANTINIEADKLIKSKKTLSIPDEDIKYLEYISKNSYLLYLYLSFKNIIVNINDTTDNKTLSNKEFIRMNYEIAEHFGYDYLFNGDQNDPHEFMAYLLDKLHDSKKISKKMSNFNNLELDDYTKLYYTNYKSTYENNYSLFVKNFYYYVLTAIQCNKCKHISNAVSPSDILCLSIPDEFLNKSMINNNLTIYNCLNDMFKVENIQYKCEKCNNYENNIMEKQILTKTKTLILKIKRYYTLGNRIVKNNQNVKYPIVLNMKPYIVGDSLLNYELYGIINHVGGLNSGHYYSFIRKYNEKNNKFDKQWYCCNDSQITEISNEEALTSENAYILFYNLIE
jgi:ubiquitin carboxyl-terminal hydrolase 2/21